MKWPSRWVLIVVCVCFWLPMIAIDDPTDQKLTTIGGILMWWYVRWEMRG